ncbi:MAG: hypothetical protein BWK76_08965 [Desulfobulbaceae bacterium A2]|nr:MAG: hypothetical protein BWK76_08965 [Desulfobulbaceae bacterium A2]
MTQLDEKLNALKQEIDRYQADKPYVQPLLEAFRPLILARYRLLGTLWEGQAASAATLCVTTAESESTTPAAGSGVCVVDPIKFAGGIFLGQQCRLFLLADPWKDLGLGVAVAVSEGFPRCAQDMTALAAAIEGGRVAVGDLFLTDDGLDELVVRLRNQGVTIEPSVLVLWHSVVSRIVLAKRTRDVTRQLAALTWTKGYCPLCGSHPMLSITRDKGQRWLQCARCSHEWQYPWDTCPWCEHKSPEETDYFFVEGEKEDKGFVCTHCRKYLLAIRRPTGLLDEDNDIAAISLAHLDLILQQKGLTPMAECAWNALLPRNGAQSA